MADENPLLVGNRALSRTGHAAVAMKGTDNKWINIQTNTFNNWINEQLREAGHHVENLEDFYDGVILCALVETLQRKHIGKVIKKPTNHHQMLHNANLALTAISGDKVKLVNIGPEDIINGNGKLILGLVWQLILRYQIGRSKFLSKNLIAWLRAVIPQCNITNFTKDWNDGVALHALIDYCKPGISPEWNKLERTKSLENCQHGMELAKKNFNIPLVLRPEDLSSNELDELSGMTYLSYYAKEDSPGYHATLNWVRDLLNENVNNFTTDWNDGTILGKLVSAMGAEIPPLTGSNINKLQQAIDGGKSLGVEPVLSAKEMADIEVEHLGIMAYAARFGHLKPIKLASECVKFTANLNNVNVGSESNFSLKILEDSLNHNDLMVEIKGPTASVPEHLIWHGDTVKGRFTVTEPGAHYINVFWKKQVIKDCPVHFVTVVDTGKIKIDHPNHMTVGNPEEIRLDMSFAGQGELCVEATSPGGCIYDLPLTPHKGQSVAKFLPQEPGEWRVKVMCDGDAIPGNPFTVKVIDPVAVSVYGLNGGAVGTPCAFSVDCSKAGESKLKVDITHNENYVPSNLVDIGARIYNVEFTPPMAGEYNVNVVYGDTSVKGSPFNLSIVDSNMVRFNWSGDKLIPIDQSQSFSIDTSNAGEGEVHCAITVDASETGAGNLEIMVNGGRVPCTVKNKGKKKFVASFLPENQQPHKIDMKFNSVTVAGSPWHIDVTDDYHNEIIQSQHVKRVSKQGLKHSPMHKTVSFLIETDSIPAKDLDIIVKSPSEREVACQLYPEKSGYRVEYTPTEVGTYSVQVFFAGSPVSDAPLTMKTYDSNSINVTQVPNGVVNKAIEFFIDVTKAGEGQLEIMINNGSLPNAVSQQRAAGLYKVSFVPEEAMTHYVDIRFNGERLQGTPYTCQVIDSALVNLQVHRLVPVQQSSHFVIQSQNILSAGLDPSIMSCVVEIISPVKHKVPVSIMQLNTHTWSGHFTPTLKGAYNVSIQMLNHELPGSPFTIHCYDTSEVQLGDVKEHYLLGHIISFPVEVSQAGEGEITAVAADLDGNIQYCETKQIRDGLYEIELCPLSIGSYCIDVIFNDQFVPGCPLVATVIDIEQIKLHQHTATQPVCNTLHYFYIKLDNGYLSATHIFTSIIGPDGKDIPLKVKDIIDGVSVEWVPQVVGDYWINADFAGYAIKGSPFKVKVYDPTRVSVKPTKRGKLSKPVSFELDVGNAGAGNLEIMVGVDGSNVPHDVKKVDGSSFEVTFFPEVTKVHQVSVRFNGYHVPGSPFSCKILDASHVAVNGEGVTSAPANYITTFTVQAPNHTDLQNCKAEVTSPAGHKVPIHMSQTNNGYRAEYTPKHVGDYQVKVWYDDVEVPSNPFVCRVYDPERVQVSQPAKAYLGKPMLVELDTSVAGDGVLESEVQCCGNHVDSDLAELGDGKYELSFTPLEQLPHVATITYNGDVICGGPFHIDVYDSDLVSASGPGLVLAEIFKPTYFDVDPHSPIDDDPYVSITTPSGRELLHHIASQGHNRKVTFTPDELGRHDIRVLYGGMPINGNPFLLSTFDPSLIYIRDVDTTGRKEREVGFVVDSCKAGPGDLHVCVTLEGQRVPLEIEKVTDGKFRYMFTPQLPGVYDADVTYNDVRIPGAPVHIDIQEEVRPSMIRVNSRSNFPYDHKVNNWFVVEFGGKPINFDDMFIDIQAPSRETIACDILPQADGDYKVQWTPTIPGRYTIDVLFGGKQIQGSPFYVDVFDISKIRVGHIKSTMVGETATFDIDFGDAGKAEYALQIIGPSGTGNIAYNVEEKEDGLRVTFNPTEHGRYKVYVTYGGLDVPDCPIIIDVEDGGMPTAYGDGLVKGEEDKLTTFFVDASNLRGELAVQVEGPNSIAKCTIEERSKGTFAVSYIPVEVGMYNVVVKWNGKEIPGSPYHAGIVDARKVRVIGGWQHYMDHNDKVHLVTGEEKRIGFDVSDAGPGLLSAKVVGPSGALVPVHVDNSADNKATVIFMAKEEGAHYMHINWSDHPLVNSPFLAHSHASSKLNPDLTKVVLSGRGLKEAITHEKAEFHIDGSEAGPGKPDVRLEGVKRSIEAHLIPTGPGQYKCEYTADMAGAYLLHISWNGRTLRGSPFKVNVLQAGHSQKIQVSGEGLRGGMIGKDINVMIDTRHAGKGELSAHCMGPNLVANCNLTDMRDGTYKLSIHPQEAGRHTLHIKYGGEHVFGSPYVLMIYAQPDASKVRVSGPGVEHGLLATYHSRLIVETKGAGAGQLTVRIKGPKGAFQVEMIRETQKDRTIMCQYDPTETGIYIVQVRWSDVDVPGSPFYVHIVDSHSDLEKVLNEENGTLNQSGYWREEF